MNRHLVTVKVGIESGTDKRMQLNGLAFNQHWLKSLDTQSVQCRRPIQHNRVFTDNLFQNIPHDRFLQFNQTFGRLDRCGQPHQFQLVENERFKQLQCHQLRQTALVQFQLRTNRNNRPTGIIDTFAQQILAETTAFALDHFGQRLQRTLVGPRHRLAATAVIQQGVHCFLKHTFFITGNDFRSAQFEQPFETVVSVDNTAIQIIQIRSRKPPPIQWNKRTQFRRQYRKDFHDHPFRLDTGTLESFQNFQSLGIFLDFCFGLGILQFITQHFGFAIDINRTQQLADTFGPHRCRKLVAVFFIFCGIIIL